MVLAYALNQNPQVRLVRLLSLQIARLVTQDHALEDLQNIRMGVLHQHVMNDWSFSTISLHMP